MAEFFLECGIAPGTAREAVLAAREEVTNRATKLIYAASRSELPDSEVEKFFEQALGSLDPHDTPQTTCRDWRSKYVCLVGIGNGGEDALAARCLFEPTPRRLPGDADEGVVDSGLRFARVSQPDGGVFGFIWSLALVLPASSRAPPAATEFFAKFCLGRNSGSG